MFCFHLLKLWLSHLEKTLITHLIKEFFSSNFFLKPSSTFGSNNPKAVIIAKPNSFCKSLYLFFSFSKRHSYLAIVTFHTWPPKQNIFFTYDFKASKELLHKPTSSSIFYSYSCRFRMPFISCVLRLPSVSPSSYDTLFASLSTYKSTPTWIDMRTCSRLVHATNKAQFIVLFFLS